jgi:hypothetical protein
MALIRKYKVRHWRIYENLRHTKQMITTMTQVVFEYLMLSSI